eukprot:snap_masked-scaffold_2-processed-gene-12.26-mRNA-1 protein AED:1.00 eAED:1.00 QI:0/-1/0/0/-1/1/1/0/91
MEAHMDEEGDDVLQANEHARAEKRKTGLFSEILFKKEFSVVYPMVRWKELGDENSRIKALVGKDEVLEQTTEDLDTVVQAKTKHWKRKVWE